MAKKKKEKVVWVDDGRSLADMSNVSGTRLSRKLGRASTSTAKEKWETYWGAVKMMFVPMLVVMAAICMIYGILFAVFYLSAVL